ncbi:hypothetical protein Gasu_09230 isoform 2 [Galdieria sulphuraria]|uniref:DUF1365 domain-containing protein n=1 Tax=Galdieria sulphuraria TaxID=130081 RepID=M2W7R5_GALSU|nr:hypothetical protein Gasu_09230 isoform 1 [Galdieria sulphuraria]XP_005708371.1 hypothetical protein Gasu_09230 isoform 2 [Galdieria sulphuraria]EME31850.1 hypothetical protein isoform 1 [Galdieria sulphuraria]EME31851.1 hypothetical protein isoform 2 [Galdieria sulphuraria]|eukprot:XP_005708370.1 hypothetical protein isoform 1 [Galdieria sulphuraria]
MLYFDLDLLRHSYLAYCWPLFSYWGPALVWFRCQDYLNSQSLEELSSKVRKIVSEKVHKNINGPVRLLTHPRYFGVSFNPVSFFYVFDESGKYLEAVVALISNIPWLESHIEVLVPKETQYDASLSSSLIVMKSHPKAFHVSPFLPMENIEYNWCFSNPIENLRVTTLLKHQQHNILFASLDLERHAWSLLSLLIFLFRYPFMTWKVIFAIHWEAYQLWKRKFPFYSHPNNSQNVWSRMIDFFSSWFY